MRRHLAAMLGLLALIGAPAVSALGLGEIEVRSSLNQPFSARIPLLAVPTDDVDAVRVKLADNADFDRMGIERADYLSNLSFKVVTGSPPRIEIEASRAVREPFLTFLLDVRSATGRVLREYTVLLDPPPPIIAAAPMPPPAPPLVTSAPLTATPAPAAATSLPAAPPVSAPTPAVTTRAPASSSTASRPPVTGEYHVEPKETLWGVATAVRPDADVSMNQVIYALVSANPTAFDRGRFEGLMKNITLAVPSRESMLTTSPAAADAAVARWRRTGSIAPAPAAAPRGTPRPVAAPTAAPPTATPSPTLTATPVPATAVEPPPAPPAVVDAVAGGEATVVPQVEPVVATDEGAATAATSDRGETEGVTPDVEPGDAAEGAAETGGDASYEAEFEPAPPDDGVAFDTIDTTTPAVSGDAGGPKWLLWLLALMIGLIALLMVRRRQAETAGKAPPPPSTPPTKMSPVMAATAGAAGAQAADTGPDSVEAAQRQADEAEALFMAAYAEEQAEAERVRQEADPADVNALPDFDAAEVIGEPEATDRDRIADIEIDPALEALGEPETRPDLDVAAPVAVGLDAADPAAPADPLAEAETHAAFGLYDDALDVLDTALEGDPYRPEWLVKRAEVMLDAGRIRAFIAAAANAKPHVSDAQWASLAAAGRGVAPDEPLFGGVEAPKPDVAPPPSAAEGEAAFHPPLISESTPEFDDGRLEFTLDDLPPLLPEPAPPAKADDNFLDFDLNFDDAPAPPAADSPRPDAPADDLLPFDLSGFDDEPKASAPPPPTPSPAAPGAGELDSLDDFKLDDFSLDDELADDPDADSDSLGMGDEAATKLDLARAYVDMGDAEMARALLGEVLVEGSDHQQEEARVLLARLA